MPSSTLKQATKKMQEAKEHLQTELNNIRSGRANPALLDAISVEVYGAKMRLKDIANITTPEARQLLVTPFDSNNTGAIGKAIEKANIGINPIVDANMVRLNVPPMDEAQRKDKVKLAKKKGEDSKVTIRNIRRDSNETVKRLKNNNEIGEDVMHSQEKEIQKITDQFCKEIDDIIILKEKDILSI